jgi:hypothetical protein
MKRKNFFLSDTQIKRLEKESKQLDIKTSELIRRIIDEYFYKKDGNKDGLRKTT